MVTVTVDGETLELTDGPYEAAEVMQQAGLSRPERYDLMLIDDLASDIVVTGPFRPSPGSRYVTARRSTTVA